MIKETIDALEQASLDKLVGLANREIGMSYNKNLGSLFILSMAIVKRVSKYYGLLAKDNEDTLAASVVSLTYLFFNREASEEELTVRDVESLVKKELRSIRLYMYDEQFAVNSLEMSTPGSVTTDKISMIKTVERWNKYIPVRLVPIIQFYLDYGVAHISTLNTVDRFLVSYILVSLGGTMKTVDADEISQLVPKTMTEKMIFLSILAEMFPLAFILLTQLGSINNLFLTLNLLNSPDFPSESEMINIMETVRKESSLTDDVKSRLFKDGKMLTIVASRINFDTPSTGGSLVSILSATLTSEAEQYIKTLDRLADRAVMDSKQAPKYFQLLMQEQDLRTKLVEKLKE